MSDLRPGTGQRWTDAKPSLREDSPPKPNADTRYTLAVLDNTIIDLTVEAKASRDMAQEATTRAERLDTLRTRLMEVRAALHPTLDPSAPREYPYDKR